MSLVGSLMQELRAEYSDRYDKNELRESRYGALRFFQEDARQRPIFDEETIANIMRSYGNTVQVVVLDAQTVTINTPYTRTCAIVDDENDSAIVALTFASYGWGFSMTEATHFNNEVKYQTDFNRKMRKYLVQFAADLDALCVAQLEADKNQYFPAGSGPLTFYAQVGNALQVPQAEKNDFYNNLESIMATMDYYDNIMVVANNQHQPLVRRLDNQGSSNATNEGFQFDLRGYRWNPTNRVINGGGTIESTGYAMELGSTFIWNRNDPDSIAGRNIGGDFKVWGQEMMPLVDFNMGTFYQQDCADRSAIGGAGTVGNTRARVEGFEFSSDFVLATPYNSDPTTLYNPILKFEVLTT